MWRKRIPAHWNRTGPHGPHRPNLERLRAPRKERRSTPPARRTQCAALRENRALGQSGLETRLRRAVAAGELPGTLDVAAVAAFYLTVQQGMSIQARDGASEFLFLGLPERIKGATGSPIRPIAVR